MFTFDLAQKLSSSLLSVEWSHSGYVTTCFINSLVAVLWEQRIKLTSPVGLWHRGSCVCVLACECDVATFVVGLWGVIPHPDFCHLSTCVRRAVSAYSWQVAVWTPFLLLAAEIPRLWTVLKERSLASPRPISTTRLQRCFRISDLLPAVLCKVTCQLTRVSSAPLTP